jgi:hypothetical protein
MPRTRPNRRESTGLLSRLLAPRATAGPRRPRRSRPGVEPLEGRQLLSFLGSEHLVSTKPQATANFESDNASSADGTSVAVWVNNVSATNNDIWAQRFDQTGHAVGAPIPVDTLASHDSYSPHVAMDAQGRFVVTWGDMHSVGNWSVLMRYYNAAGSPVTGVTSVTAASSSDWLPDVAASDGSFVISWSHRGSSTDEGILAERFTVTGPTNAPTITPKGIFGVNTDANLKDFSSVAMAPDGKFDIAYQRQAGAGSSNWDILASQYGSTGSLVRGNIHINLDGDPEANPSIAMDDAGNAVVAYQRLVGGDYGIYANRLSAGGVVGGMITVHDDSGINETDPSVALAPTGGQFVVAYDNSNGTFGVTEMDSNNAPLATLGPVVGFSPAISIDGFDRYLVTYTRAVAPTGRWEVFSRRDFLS